jgi:hypothetical protein
MVIKGTVGGRARDGRLGPNDPPSAAPEETVLAPPQYVPWIRTGWKGLAEWAKTCNWMASAEPEPLLAPAPGVTLRSEVGDGPALDDSPRGVALCVEVNSTALSPRTRDSKSPNQTTLSMTSTARTSNVGRSLRLRPGRSPLGETDGTPPPVEASCPWGVL